MCEGTTIQDKRIRMIGDNILDISKMVNEDALEILSVSLDEMMESDCVYNVGGLHAMPRNLSSTKSDYTAKNILYEYIINSDSILVNLTNNCWDIPGEVDMFWIGRIDEVEGRATPNIIYEYMQDANELGRKMYYNSVIYLIDDSYDSWLKKGWIKKIKKNNFYFKKIFIVWDNTISGKRGDINEFKTVKINCNL